PCAPQSFGDLRIRSPAPHPADITLDVPTTAAFFFNVSLANLAEDPDPGCQPQLTNCLPGSCTIDLSDPFAPAAEFNYPSPAALSGGGYRFIAESGGCGPVTFVDSPED